jgi:hypothetical protein
MIFSSKWLVPTAFLALLTACTSAEQKVLAPYATATVTAGVGLGNLELGKTTLGWVVENLDAKKVAVLIGDEVAFEPRYLQGQFSLLFIISGECQEQTGAPMTRVDIKNSIEEFLSQYPACKNLTLSSLSVGAGNNEKNTFFKGSTTKGVKLWSPLVTSLQHGTPLQNPGRFVTGDSAVNLERIEFSDGIYFYYALGEQPTDAEIRSGQQLSPERQEELKLSAEEAAKAPTVQRLTIFIPE